MNKYIFLIFMLFVTDILFGQTIEGYSFDNYKIIDPIPKSKAQIDYSSNPTAKQMRSRVSSRYSSGAVDFAGYYITIIWGCGTGCILGAMVDVRDGKVYDLPLGEVKAYYFCNSEKDADDRLLYKANSRLFISSSCDRSEIENSQNMNKEKIYYINIWDESKKEFLFIKKIKKNIIIKNAN